MSIRGDFWALEAAYAPGFYLSAHGTRLSTSDAPRLFSTETDMRRALRQITRTKPGFPDLRPVAVSVAERPA